MGILDIFGNKKLIQEIEELKNKHKQLEGKLKQKNEELEALTLEKEDLMDKTLKKDTEIFNLKREISLSKVAYNTDKFQYKKLEEKNSELLENYNKVVKENNKLKQDYKIIEDGMKIKNKEHEKSKVDNIGLRKEVLAKDTEVLKLEKKIEDIKSQYEDTKEKEKNLEGEKLSLLKDNKTTKEELLNTREKVESLEVVVKEKSGKIENLEVTLKEKDKKIDDLEVILKGKYEKIDDLEAKLKEKDKKVKALETRIENLNLENSEQEKKFLSNEIKVDVLKSELELKNNKLYYITKQLEDLEDELEKKTEENQAKEEENQALKEKEKALELKIEEYEKDSTEKEVRIEKLESDLESKIEENQDLTTEIEDLKEELRKYKIAYIKQREKFNTLKNAYTKAVNILKNLKSKKDERNDEVETKVKDSKELSTLKWNNYNAFIQNKDNLLEYLKTFSIEDFKYIYSELRDRKILKAAHKPLFTNILRRMSLHILLSDTDILKIKSLYQELIFQMREDGAFKEEEKINEYEEEEELEEDEDEYEEEEELEEDEDEYEEEEELEEDEDEYEEEEELEEDEDEYEEEEELEKDKITFEKLLEIGLREGKVEITELQKVNFDEEDTIYDIYEAIGLLQERGIKIN